MKNAIKQLGISFLLVLLIVVSIGARTGSVNLDGTTGRMYSNEVSQTPMGEIYVNANATATTITTQNTFTKVSGTTSSGQLVDFTHPSAGKLCYGGTETRGFHMGVTLAVEGAGDADDSLFVVYKNGTLNENNEYTGGAQLTAGMVPVLLPASAGAGEGTAIHVMTTMDQNDCIELAVSNETDTDDVTVTYMNLFAVGMTDSQ